MYPQGQVVDYMAETDIQNRVTRMVQYAVRKDNGDFVEAVCPKTGLEMTLLRNCICTPEEGEPRHFYVSVKDSDKADARTGFLLGPYATWEEAEANRKRGRKLAEQESNDPKAFFYHYGTCSSPVSVVIKTVFGK